VKASQQIYIEKCDYVNNNNNNNNKDNNDNNNNNNNNNNNFNLHPNIYIQMQKSVILGTCPIVRNFLSYK
jgi:hypothetical protein